nr:hypothetical protein HmN_000260400 [Hymenolepis microstoma]
MQKPRSVDSLESYLIPLSHSIPDLQWWKFDFSSSIFPKHVWISLPYGVQIVSGKQSLLPSNTRFLGRLNIFSWGEECSVNGIRITPTQRDQLVCIETRSPEQQCQILWIDINRPAVVKTPSGDKEIVDVKNPSQPLPGSTFFGWVSGLEIDVSKPHLVTNECFLVPVDFTIPDDVAVVLSRPSKLSNGESVHRTNSKSEKVFVVNSQSDKPFPCPYESIKTSQTYTCVKKTESLHEDDCLEEVGGDLEFPATMIDNETGKHDTDLSETLVEIEDLFNRVVWIIQNDSDTGSPTRDRIIEAQRHRIELQLEEMRHFEGEFQSKDSNRPLSLLEKLLTILTCLLEIGEMVNLHRRVDNPRLLQLVKNKIPKLTSWMNSQSKDDYFLLRHARETISQLTNIQSALTCLLGIDQSDIGLKPSISEAQLCLNRCIEKEINEKLEDRPTDDRIHFNINNVLSNFIECFNECVTKISSTKNSTNRGNYNLRQISADLSEKANFLKANGAWISCILNEEICERLVISHRNYNNLRLLYENALKAYKLLVVRSRLVCEHSGLQALASRLTSILEQSAKNKLSRWEICHLERELDGCEAECVFEAFTNTVGCSEFVREVIFHLRESILRIRKNLNEVEIKQESFTSEFLERLNIVISQPQQSISTDSSFELLLGGWYLQTISITSKQVNELINQLERSVSESLQNPLTADDYVSQLEDFIEQIPSTLPPNAEAISLRETLLIVSDIIHRGNAAVQLLERLAFLMNLRSTQRLEKLRYAYPKAVESLSSCFQALEGVLREFLEWRNTLLLGSDPDEAEVSAQAVIESINFAMDVLTQEVTHTRILKFTNAPDFLSVTLAWLSSLPTYLLSFPDAFSESQLESSTVSTQTDSLLLQVLDLEWRLADSSIQTRKDLYKELAEQFELQSNWMSDIDELKNSVDIKKRRAFLNAQEGIERSARSRNSNYYHVLASSREMNKVVQGFSMVDFIVSRAEAFQDIDIPKLSEEISKASTPNEFGDKFSKLRLDSFFEQIKLISDEYKQHSKKRNLIQGGLHTAECFRKVEVLSDIGKKLISVLKQPSCITNRVLCCYWPEAIKRTISIDQSQIESRSYTEWFKNAIALRNVVAESLVPDHIDPSGFQQNRILIEKSFKNFRRSIIDAETVINNISIDFKPNYEVIYQTCSRLRDTAESYSSQLHEHIKNLTLYSLPKVKKDLQHLEDNLNDLVNNRTAKLSLEDCSSQVVQLERNLQALRHLSRILFTCLSANPKSVLTGQPSEPLEVNELYKRAVKIVRDYEASENGYQIVDAWKKLQEIADKLGCCQAGLPIEQVAVSAEMEIGQAPTCEYHMEEYPSASMARKRSWTLLEILGSHECLYPGCREKKRDKHYVDDEGDTLLHDLHLFYTFLCSEYNSYADQSPCDILTPDSNKAASSEIILMKVREEWHHNKDLLNEFNNLQRRVGLNSGGDLDIESTFTMIENLWGRPTTPKFAIESSRKLATVSSWLCEVEQQMELVILPRLQASWNTPSSTDSLSVVEECVYMMNEIAEDLDRLQRCEMITAKELQSIRNSLRAGWFSVREYLLIRCNKLTTDSARYFPLVDDFVNHSVGFKDYSLLNIYNRLCGQFLLKGPRQRRSSHSQPDGRNFCTTKMSLRSLFLPYWFTERCRLVNDRPPVALTIHSLPDISTEAYPTPEPTFHSPRCVSINSRRWISLPEIRPVPQIVYRRRVENSFSVVEEDADTIISPFSGLHDSQMSTSGVFFIPQADEEKNDVKNAMDQAYNIPSPPGARRKPEVNDSLSTPKELPATRPRNYLTTHEPISSYKSRDKSPLTWCTIYLPNDEQTESVINPEIVPKGKVVEVADDPIVPPREVYAPMVFSAPLEIPDEEVENDGSELIEETTAAECGPSITDDSGVCDWLRTQQAVNIQRLIQEYGDGVDDMPLTDVDCVSNNSNSPDFICRRNKNSVSASFEESGLGEEEWSRKSMEVPSLDKEEHSPTETSEDHVNWGPLIERPASPHLSVISEASTDESAFGKQIVVECSQMASEETSGDEDIKNSGKCMDVNPIDLVINGRKIEILPSLDDTGLADTSTPIVGGCENTDNPLSSFFSHGSQEGEESDEEADETISALLSQDDGGDEIESLTSPNTNDVEHGEDERNFSSEVQSDENQQAMKLDGILEPFQPKEIGKKSYKRKYQEIQEAEDGRAEDYLYLENDDREPKCPLHIPEMSPLVFSVQEHDEVPPGSSPVTIPLQYLTEQNTATENVGNLKIDVDSLEENVLEDSLHEVENSLDEDDFSEIRQNKLLFPIGEKISNVPEVTEQETSEEIKRASAECSETRSKKSKGLKTKESKSKENKNGATNSAKSATLENNLSESSCKEGFNNLPEEQEKNDPGVILLKAPEEIAQSVLKLRERERSLDANHVIQHEKSGDNEFNEEPFPLEVSVVPEPIGRDITERMPKEMQTPSQTGGFNSFSTLDERDRSFSCSDNESSNHPIETIPGVDDADLAVTASTNDSVSPSEEADISEPPVIELTRRVPVPELTKENIEEERLRNPKASVRVDEIESDLSSKDANFRCPIFFKDWSTKHPINNISKADGTELMRSIQQEGHFREPEIPDIVVDTPDHGLSKTDNGEIPELSLFVESNCGVERTDKKQPSTSIDDVFSTSSHLEPASLSGDDWIDVRFKKTRKHRSKKSKGKEKDARNDKDLPKVETVMSSGKNTDWFGDAQKDKGNDLKGIEIKWTGTDEEMSLEVPIGNSPLSAQESEALVGENSIPSDIFYHQAEVPVSEIKDQVDASSTDPNDGLMSEPKKKGRNNKKSKKHDVHRGNRTPQKAVEITQPKARSSSKESDELRESISNKKTAFEKYDENASRNSKDSSIEKGTDIVSIQPLGGSANEDKNKFQSMTSIPTISEGIEVRQQNSVRQDIIPEIEESTTSTELNSKILQNPEIASHNLDIADVPKFQESVMVGKDSIPNADWATRDDSYLRAPSELVLEQNCERSDSTSKKRNVERQKETEDITADIQESGSSTTTSLVELDEYHSEVKSADESSQFVTSKEERVCNQSQIGKIELISTSMKLSPELKQDERLPQASELPYSGGEIVTEYRDLDREYTEIQEVLPSSDFDERNEDVPLGSRNYSNLNNSSESTQKEPGEWIDGKSKKPLERKQKKSKDDEENMAQSTAVDTEGEHPLAEYPSEVNLADEHIESIEQIRNSSKIDENEPTAEIESDRRVTQDSIVSCTKNKFDSEHRDSYGKSSEIENLSSPDLKEKSDSIPFTSLERADISKDNLQSESFTHSDSSRVETQRLSDSDKPIADTEETLVFSKEIDDVKITAGVGASEFAENQSVSSEISLQSTLSAELTEVSLISSQPSSKKEKNGKDKKRDLKKIAQTAALTSGAKLVYSGSMAKIEVQRSANSLRLVNENVVPGVDREKRKPLISDLEQPMDSLSHPYEKVQSLNLTAFGHRENFPSGIKGNANDESLTRKSDILDVTEPQGLPSKSITDGYSAKLENTPQKIEVRSSEAVKVYEIAPHESESTSVGDFQDEILTESNDIYEADEWDSQIQLKTKDEPTLSDLGKDLGLENALEDKLNGVTDAGNLEDQLKAAFVNPIKASQRSRRKRKPRHKKGGNGKEKMVDIMKSTEFKAELSAIEEKSDQKSDSNLKQVTMEPGHYEVQHQIQSDEYSCSNDVDYYLVNPLAVEGFSSRSLKVDEYKDQLKEPRSNALKFLPPEYQSEPYRPPDSITEEHLASFKSLKPGDKSQDQKIDKTSALETPTSSNIYIPLDESKRPGAESVTIFTNPTSEMKELFPFKDCQSMDNSENRRELPKHLKELDTRKSLKEDEILSFLPSTEECQLIEESKAPMDELSREKDIKTVTKPSTYENEGTPLPKSSYRRGGNVKTSPQSKISHKSLIVMPESEAKEEADKTLGMVEFCTNLSTAEVEEEEEQESSSSSIEIISSVDLETDPNLQEIPAISSDVNIESAIRYQDEELRDASPDEFSFTILEKANIEPEVPENVRVELEPEPENIVKKTLQEPLDTPSSRLKVSVKRSPCRWSRLPIFLFLLLLILIPLLLLLCVVNPDYCVLPGLCPGLDLRQRINFHIREFHRRRMPHYPI